MNSYIIYKYTSPSGKHYIGQTNDIVRRKSQHKKTNGCPCFKSAVDKYGFENFEFEILEECLTVNEANDKEDYYIQKYNSLAPNGYNLHTGGLNHSVSELTRERLRIASSGENNPNFGKRHSEETKAKIGASSRNRKHILAKIHEDNAKTYVITFPDNHKETIKNMAKFCREHNLVATTMTKVALGKQKKKHRGFSCVLVQNLLI